MDADRQVSCFVSVPVFALLGHVADDIIALASGFRPLLVAFAAFASVAYARGVVAVSWVHVFPFALWARCWSVLVKWELAFALRWRELFGWTVVPVRGWVRLPFLMFLIIGLAAYWVARLMELAHTEFEAL